LVYKWPENLLLYHSYLLASGVFSSFDLPFFIRFDGMFFSKLTHLAAALSLLSTVGAIPTAAVQKGELEAGRLSPFL
jgi:hypothetical protein